MINQDVTVDYFAAFTMISPSIVSADKNKMIRGKMLKRERWSWKTAGLFFQMDDDNNAESLSFLSTTIHLLGSRP